MWLLAGCLDSSQARSARLPHFRSRRCWNCGWKQDTGSLLFVARASSPLVTKCDASHFSPLFRSDAGYGLRMKGEKFLGSFKKEERLFRVYRKGRDTENRGACPDLRRLPMTGNLPAGTQMHLLTYKPSSRSAFPCAIFSLSAALTGSW